MLVLLAGSAACAAGDDDDSGEPDAGIPLAECPVNRVLDEACACNGARFDPSASGRWLCDGAEILAKDLPDPRPDFPRERCDGLDNDLDGETDEEGVCAQVCSPENLSSLFAAVRMPAVDDQTVASEGGETPAFGQYLEIPEWCESPSPGSSMAEAAVLCGEALEVSGALSRERIRVAPGGVLRLVDSAALVATEELLLCPGAVIQSGGDSSLDGTGADAGDVHIETPLFLHLGEIITRGGATGTLIRPAGVGAAGSVTIDTERWLFAGVIDTSGADHPDGYTESLDGGASGAITVAATRESYVAGKIVVVTGSGGSHLGCGAGGHAADPGGDVYLEVPVCCHEGNEMILVGGNGGDGGLGEDAWEGAEPRRLTQPGEYGGSLCDAEDRFDVSALGGQRLRLAFDPLPGEDIDLELEQDGVVIDRSEGIGETEEIEIPADGRYLLRVISAGPVVAPGGPYSLVFE